MESAGPQISKAYLDAMKSLQDNLRNLKTEHRSLRLEYETVSKENSMLSADKGQLLEQLHRSQTHSVGRWGSESFEQLQLGERSQLVARIYELQQELASVRSSPMRVSQISQLGLRTQMTPLAEPSRLECRSLLVHNQQSRISCPDIKNSRGYNNNQSSLRQEQQRDSVLTSKPQTRVQEQVQVQQVHETNFQQENRQSVCSNKSKPSCMQISKAVGNQSEVRVRPQYLPASRSGFRNMSMASYSHLSKREGSSGKSQRSRSRSQHSHRPVAMVASQVLEHSQPQQVSRITQAKTVNRQEANLSRSKLSHASKSNAQTLREQSRMKENQFQTVRRASMHRSATMVPLQESRGRSRLIQSTVQAQGRSIAAEDQQKMMMSRASIKSKNSKRITNLHAKLGSIQTIPEVNSSESLAKVNGREEIQRLPSSFKVAEEDENRILEQPDDYPEKEGEVLQQLEEPAQIQEDNNGQFQQYARSLEQRVVELQNYIVTLQKNYNELTQKLKQKTQINAALLNNDCELIKHVGQSKENQMRQPTATEGRGREESRYYYRRAVALRQRSRSPCGRGSLSRGQAKQLAHQLIEGL